MTGQNLGGGLGALGKRCRVTQALTLDLSGSIANLVPFSSARFDNDGIFNATGTALTGTVSKTNGSATVTGSGTAFTTELAVGDYIQIGTEILQISAIGSNISLTTSAAWGVTASGISATKPPTRLTCRTPGLYLVTFRAYVTTGAITTQDRDVRIRLNGTTLIDFERLTSSNRTDTQMLAVSPWELAAGDYVEGQVSAAGTGRLSVSSPNAPELSMVGLG